MDVTQKVLSLNGFSSFNPMQEKALQKDLFNQSLVVSAPTAAGKTVLAELAALNSVLNRKQKVVYTCPLRALASEHYHDFKKKYAQSLDIRASISTGDFDSSSNYLANYDVIYSTYEKLDSLTRHHASWLQSIGLLIVDEIHELDSDRGPTLEMVITKLRHLNPKLQVLALSATIPNAKELAAWLEAELVQSDYRPCKLQEGVYFDQAIKFSDGILEPVLSGREPVHALAEDTLAKAKQALVFANTRKRAEGLAKQLAGLCDQALSDRERRHLAVQAERALNALEQPTEQCHTLHELLKKGVSFHHAGLLQKQREIVEALFKEGYLKFVCCTPTLAAGINMPAYRVVVTSVYRYTEAGSEKIPVREYKQMAGRAGRPKFDKAGQAIILSKSSVERDELLEYFVNGEIEPVESKLAYEPVLRTHVLAAIAGNFVFDLASLEQFFSKTFYAHQSGGVATLFLKLNDIIAELGEMGFVQADDNRFLATKLGRRVSELYLDPRTAHKFIKGLERFQHVELFYLYLWTDCSEAMPWLSVPKAKEAELWERLQAEGKQLPISVEEEMFSDPVMLKKFFTSLMFKSWIEEMPEQALMKDYGIAPGSLFQKTKNLDWLVYATAELAQILDLREHLPFLNRLRKRLQSGIREELVYLCEVRGIGRVRARRLFANNVRTVADLKKIPLASLARLLPPKVAEKIKEQLGVPEKLSEDQKKSLARSERAGQSQLGEF